MKKAYYIMQLSQIGNVGAHEIKKIKDQPEHGFSEYFWAEKHMMNLAEDKKYPFDMGYNFTIMPLYTNKNA